MIVIVINIFRLFSIPQTRDFETVQKREKNKDNSFLVKSPDENNCIALIRKNNEGAVK